MSEDPFCQTLAHIDFYGIGGLDAPSILCHEYRN